MLQFSCSVMSDSLWPCIRLPCPSPTPGACSCPLSRWCHSTISSSDVPFSCLQSFPVSGSSPISQLFTSGGQSIEALVSVPSMNIQDWFSWGLTGLIYLQSKGLSRVFSNTTVQKHRFFSTQLSLWSNSHTHTGKAIAFVGKVMSLLFNMLSRLVIAFLPRNKRLLISWLQSPSAVILEPPKIKSFTVSTVSPSICHEVMGLDAMILVFWMLSFKSAFSLSFIFIKRLFGSSSLSAIRVVSSAYLRMLFLPAILKEIFYLIFFFILAMLHGL